MWKVYAVLLVAVCCTVVMADPPVPAWIRMYGGDGMQRAFAVCAAPDGGAVVAGFNMPNGQTTYGPFTIRLNDAGDSLWSCSCPTEFWSAGTYFCRGIAPASNGGYVIAGCAYTSTTLAPFLARITADGTVSWSQSYSNWNGMDLRAVVRTVDGNYAATGIWSSDGITSDVIVFKTDSMGTLLWSHSFGGAGSDSGNALVALPDGGLAVAGSFQASSGASCLMYLIRLNAAGDSLWTRRYGEYSYNSAGAIITTADGGFALAGVNNQLSATMQNAIVVRTDSAGNMEWGGVYALRGASYSCAASAIIELHDGSFVTAGWTQLDTGSDYDGFLAGINAAGDTLWTEYYGLTNGDRFKALALAPDGGYFAAGYEVPGAVGADDILVLRFRPRSGVNGTVTNDGHLPVANARVWALGQSEIAQTNAQGQYSLPLPPGTYDLVASGPCTQQDTTHSVVVPADSFVVADWELARPHISFSRTSITMVVHNHVADTASLMIYNAGPGNLYLTLRADAVDPSGNWFSVWPDSVTLLPHDSLYVAVRVLTDTLDNHNYEFLGFLRAHGNSCPDSAVSIAVNSTVLNSGDHSGTLPARFDLSAYPNPFNPLTTLSLSLPQRSRVELRLYDVTGQTVKTLCDGVLEAGVQHIRVDGSGLPSGIYFVRLQTPAFVRAQKLVLLK